MSTAIATENPAVTIVVDLDGTLVSTDTLFESLVAAAHDWSTLWRVPLWLFSGRTALKAGLAERCKLDIQSLPFNPQLLAYLKEKKNQGSRLMLMTGAHQSVAEDINRHLGIFDEVVGSTSCNLRGRQKAKALAERFGCDPFCYIGNDRTDLHVWKTASSGVVVNASRRVARLAAGHTRIERVIERPASLVQSLIHAMRPHQWVKNLLVFVPMVTANVLGDLAAWQSTIVTFLAFCFMASATYLINDLLDLKADRLHPSKRYRPFASGALPVKTGIALAPLLLIAGLVAGSLSGVTPFLIAYAVVSLGYSLKVKELALVDLFALAFLYTIRLFAGGVAIDHHVSLWLLAFSGFLFFSLASVKRIAELLVLRDLAEPQMNRRGYLRADLAPLLGMGVSASFASSVVMALYVQSQAAAGNFPSNEVLWALVPLFLYWQCRLWLLSHRGLIKEDPVIYTVRDRSSWVVAILMGITLFLANVRFG